MTPDIAQAMNIEPAKGALVSNVSDDTPAQRAGKPVTLTAKVGRLADDDTGSVASIERPPSDLGLALAPLNNETRSRFELPAKTRGAVVVAVQPGSAAAERNIQPGDVIVQVNGREVTSPQDVVEAVKQAKADKRKSVALLVRHGEREGFIALPLA